MNRVIPKTSRKMGTFYVGCKVENHKEPKQAAVVPKLLVDTGSDYTWLPGGVLEGIGIEPVKKDLQIEMANGQIVTRDVGYAILRVDKYETIDEVVFAQRGDLLLLGARALEGLRVHVDPRRKRLVASGPALAATTICSEVARAMGMVVGSPRKVRRPTAAKKRPAAAVRRRVRR